MNFLSMTRIPSPRKIVPCTRLRFAQKSRDMLLKCFNICLIQHIVGDLSRNYVRDADCKVSKVAGYDSFLYLRVVFYRQNKETLHVARAERTSMQCYHALSPT